MDAPVGQAGIRVAYQHAAQNFPQDRHYCVQGDTVLKRQGLDFTNLAVFHDLELAETRRGIPAGAYFFGQIRQYRVPVLLEQANGAGALLTPHDHPESLLQVAFVHHLFYQIAVSLHLYNRFQKSICFEFRRTYHITQPKSVFCQGARLIFLRFGMGTRPRQEPHKYLFFLLNMRREP